jgi:plastocyanin
MKPNMAFLSLLVSVLVPAAMPGATPQGLDVQAQIQITYPGAQKASAHRPSSAVVLWLSGVTYDSGDDVKPASPGHFRMAQKNKGFTPHLLVVQLGSTVEFPNLDPFFHNVFSQFNGKRFDLGLYEAGSTKGVRFDHEGGFLHILQYSPGDGRRDYYLVDSIFLIFCGRRTHRVAQHTCRNL